MKDLLQNSKVDVSKQHWHLQDVIQPEMVALDSLSAHYPDASTFEILRMRRELVCLPVKKQNEGNGVENENQKI